MGLKQTEPNPWELIAQKYPSGSLINGKIRNITDFGVFVEVSENVDGFVHISDISWTKKIKHPSEIFKVGDVIQTKVLNLDIVDERFSLGIKQLTQDPWETVKDKYPPGSYAGGIVSKVTDFGIFVKLDDAIDGLIHISEVDEETKKNLSTIYKEGDKINGVILSIDTKERKMRMSLKAKLTKEEKVAYEEYLTKQGNQNHTLGDLINKTKETIVKK